jgi:hypothetical protein
MEKKRQYCLLKLTYGIMCHYYTYGNQKGEIKMKTSEILKITDEALIVEKLWKEKRTATYERVQQEKKALEQQIKELESKTTWQYIEAEWTDEVKIADKAFEKAMAFFRTVDDDNVKKTINQYERGIITGLELMHQLQRLTVEVSYIGQGKQLTETNW